MLRDLPVFICGHPKSGTSLVRALLDSHPRLITYPEETVFFRRYLPMIKGKDADEKILLADQWLTHIFEWNLQNPPPHQKNYPGRDYSHIPVADVRSEMRRLLRERFSHDGDILSATVLAYGQVSGKISDAVRWVEKTPFNEYFADQIFKWWPEALCIHVVRDPRDNFVSYIKKHPDWHPEFFAISWRRSTITGFCNQKRYGNQRYLILRYEDLVMHPEQTLMEICNFLGIELVPSMFTPSRGGKPWDGNSMFSQKFSAISTTPMGRWEKTIQREERTIIEMLNEDVMRSLNYPFSRNDWQPLPFRKYLRIWRLRLIRQVKERILSRC
ncbi:MAG: sulfotransferase [Anaerolineales bacterium]